MNPLLQLDFLYNTPVFTLTSLPQSLKNVYGAVYVGKFAKWVFPAYYPVYTTVLKDLSIVVPNLTYSESVIEHIAKIKSFSGVSNTCVSTFPPYVHQTEGLEHVYRNYRSGLFYSPGLGKSRIIVDLYQIIKEPLLILAPKIVLSEWKNEFKKHRGIENIVLLQGSRKEKLALLSAAAVFPPAALVTTYETAVRYVTELLRVPYKVIVADESHKMKSPFSKRTKAATELATRAYRRILLSGTPALGSPFDLYGQLRFLGNCFCPENWFVYKNMFAVYASWDTQKRIPRGFKNLDILNKRVNQVCIRKTKEECLDLPEQVILDLHFDLAPSQKAVYNELVESRADTKGIEVLSLLATAPETLSKKVAVAPHVRAGEAITLIGKIDQIGSGFVYKTTENPGICTACEALDACLARNISPYTRACCVVKERPAVVVEALPDNARLVLLEEKLEEILEDPTNKVIVWAHYRAELDMIAELLKRMKWPFVRVDGATNSIKLAPLKEQFNFDPEVRVYLSQVSTGVGITLNAANYMIYYNIPWSLENWEQSLNRNHRIGQLRSVVVYRLIGNGTLDESKVIALDSKTCINTLITHSAPCVGCKKHRTCAKAGIRLYDPECMYDKTMPHTTSKVEMIP